jgi:phospholipid/cholesterol/gamma-HCH transport system substrate-binding protein
MRLRVFEFMVGLFMLAGLCALIFLAFKVSGLTLGHQHYYTITAEFDNVGDLKIRAPIAVSGVTIGRVSGIRLNANNFRAIVTMEIDDRANALPIDTSAEILTQGILGSNYVGLTPGFEQVNLKNGDRIETTHSAIILENLIGQLLYNLKGSK